MIWGNIRLWTLDALQQRRQTEVTMDDTEQARQVLAAQRSAGDHSPATECPTCGTFRTPGQSHTRKDTGGVTKTGVFTRTCSG